MATKMGGEKERRYTGRYTYVEDGDERFDGRKLGRDVFLGASLFVSTIAGCNAPTVVPAGHVGVKSMFGNVRSEKLSPGFHIVNPLVSIIKLDVKTQQIEEKVNVPTSEGH